jgi:hypothetical protein
MIENYKRGEYVTRISYEQVFDDSRGNGFAFPCDKEGNLYRNLTEAAYRNWRWCIVHPEKFSRYGKVVSYKHSWREPNTGTCHCGQEIELVNEYMGACECPKCGQWYNLFGQELRPVREWFEDENSNEEPW